ncbi:DEAD/DEAH box helicase [Dokdonella sp.]|uniref:DEAD/DEAH box helicase n=1 Tax=Dokdonella sp. TaxID=2291710 RepID=UPI003782D39E
MISPWHGVLLVGAVDSETASSRNKLEGAFNQVFSRLVRYPLLRAGRAKLKFPLDACVWMPEGKATETVLVGVVSFENQLRTQRLSARIDSDVFAELVSTLDGSKALVKPKDRPTANFPKKSKVAVIAALEEEIRRFDRDQRVAYMSDIGGPQRIQGLAGSGKTVVLALKAALTAVREPDAKIAVTFYTKSLYQHIKQLITRFYRMHEDRDPDWKKIQVLHAWGGATVDGLYYQTARRFGHSTLDFGQAKRLSASQPFAAACRLLLADPSVRDSFDYVFVDEAQDFPAEFMKLALRLAKDERLVIAYDVFQTIFDVETPTAASLFGTDGLNEPHVEFDQDIILHKCYRNPREVLVCAHAIGFGIYGRKVVQMLESKEHWEDFGYSVMGAIEPGKTVAIVRPRENSPSSISDACDLNEIISCRVFKTPSEEIGFVVEAIGNDVKVQGVPPEDILVISADDRNTGLYLSAIAEGLAAIGISVNNIHARAYGVPEFQEDGCVTLATVYKAKGNEAYAVYLVGVDALFEWTTPKSRNRAFTAMTRAKGWLTISGIGPPAEAFYGELERAKEKFPKLEFIQPRAEDLVFMKRDLFEPDPSAIDREIEELGSSLDPEDFERILRKKLRDVQSKARSRKHLKKNV